MKYFTNLKRLSLASMSAVILTFNLSLIEAHADVSRSVTGSTYYEVTKQCVEDLSAGATDSMPCFLIDDFRVLGPMVEKLMADLRFVDHTHEEPQIVIPWPVGPQCLSCPPEFVKELLLDREKAMNLVEINKAKFSGPSTQEKLQVLSEILSAVDARIAVIEENM
ncbi:MAG: hypothetical protein OEZ43_07475 [Gammaproteobacteria bacterium]|nr:hypothetical protein [Gammaproteobacteria bacterium]